MSNPLAFFTEFIELRQLQTYRDRFFDIESVNPSTTKIDTKKEMAEWSMDTLLGYESGETHFRDFLKELVTREKLAALEAIETYIQSATDASNYLELITRKLDVLTSKAKEYEELHRYPAVVAIIDSIKDDVAVYMPQRQIEVATQAPILKTTTPKTPVSTSGLRWSTKAVERSASLYILLKHNGFIEESTSPAAIANLFNHNQVDTQLKIKWIKTVKGKLSKKLLFAFFDTLLIQRLIERFDKEKMLTLIELLFLDEKGNPIENLQVSYSDAPSASATPQENLLVRLIEGIV